MKVLGVDASLRSTGVAIVEDGNVTVTGKIITNSKKETSTSQTILDIAKGILDICIQYDISTVAIEDGFGGVNVKTSLILAKVRQSIVTLLMHHDIDVYEYSPSEIRSLTVGSGRAKKEDIAAWITERYGRCQAVSELGPFSDKANKKKNSDEYDAIAVAIAHESMTRNETC